MSLPYTSKVVSKGLICFTKKGLHISNAERYLSAMSQSSAN